MTRWPLCRVTIILSQNDGDCGLTFAVFFVGGPPLGRIEDTPTIVSHLKIRCNSSPHRKLASPSNPASEVQSLLDGPEETILDFVFFCFLKVFLCIFFYQRQFPENQAKSDEARVDGVGTGGPGVEGLPLLRGLLCMSLCSMNEEHRVQTS